jgi:hypothetical protein
MLQLSQFILGNFLYIITVTVSAHLKSNIDITTFLRVLLACGKCYAQNTRFTTVIIDKPTAWPSTLSYRITSKDSTDTFIEQEARKKQIVYRYMQRTIR